MAVSGHLHPLTAVPPVLTGNGFRAGLDILEKRKSFAYTGIRTPNRPARRLVTRYRISYKYATFIHLLLLE